MLATPRDNAGERSHRSKSTKCIESHIVGAPQTQYHPLSQKMRLNSDSSDWLAYVMRNNLRAISRSLRPRPKYNRCSILYMCVPS
jgi:hypothetical protein